MNFNHAWFGNFMFGFFEKISVNFLKAAISIRYLRIFICRRTVVPKIVWPNFEYLLRFLLALLKLFKLFLK